MFGVNISTLGLVSQSFITSSWANVAAPKWVPARRLEPITGSFVEIGDVASHHWRRDHRLQPISVVYWVGQMGAGRLLRQQQRHSSQTLT
jgi:hypothetical protein